LLKALGLEFGVQFDVHFDGQGKKIKEVHALSIENVPIGPVRHEIKGNDYE
jgi:hypothetical protein